MTRIVGARELKTRLGKYLRAVRGGATLVVTDRGEPVAEIRPVTARRGAVETRLDLMAVLGLLTRGSGRPLRPVKAIRVRDGDVSRTIIDDREDRF